jgi:hypothetical protein
MEASKGFGVKGYFNVVFPVTNFNYFYRRSKSNPSSDTLMSSLPSYTNFIEPGFCVQRTHISFPGSVKGRPARLMESKDKWVSLRCASQGVPPVCDDLKIMLLI